MVEIEIPVTAQELVRQYCPNPNHKPNVYGYTRIEFQSALRAFAEAVAKATKESCERAADAIISSDETDEIYIGDAKLISTAILSVPSPIKK